MLLFFFSQSEDDIRPEDELGDLINKSLLPGPNLEITTGIKQFLILLLWILQ